MGDAETSPWTNASVRRLLGDDQRRDPAQLIAAKAQSAALEAMEKGWKGPPFDPFELAAYFGVPVVARGDVTDARLTMTDRGPRVEFNPGRRAARVRFSVAHELAHLLFEDYAEQVRERHAPDPRTGDDWQLEMLCNIGASEFLMPAGAFPAERADDLSLAHLLDLRIQFGVSTEAILRRVVRLTERPAVMFAATRNDDATARIDYTTASRSWRAPVATGWASATDSVLRRATAVGFSVDGHERWGGHDVHVQAVGVPPYGGQHFPRIIGLLTPDDEQDRVVGAGITYVRGDATEPDAAGSDILVHVVPSTTRSWGGRGFATALAQRRPEVHDSYKAWAAGSSSRLGSVHWTETDDGLSVASMVAQAGVGTDQRPRLRLGALHTCLQLVAAAARETGATVHMPLIGTGYGGARWASVRDLILDDVCADGVPVQVYVLPEASMPDEYDPQLSLLS